MTTNHNIIGFLGGSFDPVHCGHIALANHALTHLPFDQLYLLPSYQNVQKKSVSASTEHRLNMLRLAIQNQPQLSLDLREIQAKKPCYTIETLRDIRQQYPTYTLCFLLGLDLLLTLNTWHSWRTLTDYAHLVVFSRAGFTPDLTPELQAWLDEHICDDLEQIKTTTQGHVFWQPLPDWPIASRDVRLRISQGENVEKDLNPRVLTYILQHHLYHQGQ